ncbi:hypothetical protein [Escherichia albertii]|uniref:hypothetical protein n=1 Tax=Escherichia albertii TaxID=208962 RepID=UPI001EE3C345|nr:hypothetical protein [Escherichia albertii]
MVLLKNEIECMRVFHADITINLKKGHQRPVKKHPIKGTASDAFCVVLSDVMCAGRGADMKKAANTALFYLTGRKTVI